MNNTSLRFLTAKQANIVFVETAQLAFYVDGWLMDHDIRDLSPATREFRRIVTKNLLWFLKDRNLTSCSIKELRQFLMYLAVGHTDPRGRWANSKQRKPVGRRTKMDYQNALTTFFWWMVKQGIIEANPMILIDPVPHQEDQVDPFSVEQIQSMITAVAKPRKNVARSKYANSARWRKPTKDRELLIRTALRDEAILRLFYDSGIRTSELCGIKRQDLNLNNRTVRVLGKGRKERTVPFGSQCAKAIWDYLRYRPIEADEYLFQSESGSRKGEGMTRFTVRDVVIRAKARAGIKEGGAGHKIRHSCATETLRGGAEAFRIQMLLGHTTIKMTRKYINYTQSDAKVLQRFSPGDKLKRK